MHIAIAGNIGSGKTTLTKLLSKRYGWKPNFEPVDNNPYLADYYEDMKRQGGRIKMRSPPKVLTGNFRPSQLSFFLS